MLVRVVQPPDVTRLAEVFPESEGTPENRLPFGCDVRTKAY